MLIAAVLAKRPPRRHVGAGAPAPSEIQDSRRLARRALPSFRCRVCQRRSSTWSPSRSDPNAGGRLLPGLPALGAWTVRAEHQDASLAGRYVRGGDQASSANPAGQVSLPAVVAGSSVSERLVKSDQVTLALEQPMHTRRPPNGAARRVLVMRGRARQPSARGRAPSRARSTTEYDRCIRGPEGLFSRSISRSCPTSTNSRSAGFCAKHLATAAVRWVARADRRRGGRSSARAR